MLGKSPDLSGLRSLHQVSLVHHQGTAVANGVSTASWAVSALCPLGLELPTVLWSSARSWKTAPHPDAGFPIMADQAHLGQLQSRDAPPPGFSESCLRQCAEGYLLSLPCPGQLHCLCHGLQGTKDHPNGPAQLQKAFLPQSVTLSSTSMWMRVGKSLTGRGNPLG